MVNKNKKYSLITSTKFWAKFSLFILVVIGVIAFVLRVNDPAYEGLEDYLLKINDINDYVGEVESYRVVNTRYVSEASDANRYNEYRIRIVGTNGDVTLKIRADYMEDGNGWEYSVIRKYDG